MAIDRLPPTQVSAEQPRNQRTLPLKEIMEREGTFTKQKARKLGFTEAQPRATVVKAHGFKLAGRSFTQWMHR